MESPALWSWNGGANCVHNKSMARTSSGRVGRHLSHAAHVDSDHRQDPAHTLTTTESLVEFYSVCYASRSNDIHYVLPRSTSANRLRFHISCTAYNNVRGFYQDNHSPTTFGSRLLSGNNVGLGIAWDACKHLDHAGRSLRSNAI
jgi:hypothetical protein